MSKELFAVLVDRDYNNWNLIGIADSEEKAEEMWIKEKARYGYIDSYIIVKCAINQFIENMFEPSNNIKNG